MHARHGEHVTQLSLMPGCSLSGGTVATRGMKKCKTIYWDNNAPPEKTAELQAELANTMKEQPPARPDEQTAG